jgi:hypothetical protein
MLGFEASAEINQPEAPGSIVSTVGDFAQPALCPVDEGHIGDFPPRP